MDPTPQTKVCRDCGATRPLKEFYYKKARKQYNSYCKPCHQIRTKNWYAARPDKLKEVAHKSRIKRSYGLTPEQVAEMSRKQDSLCAICGDKPGTFIDHCHKTGKVRELLCSTCNLGIGQLQDSTRILMAAVAYLEKHGDS